MYLNRTFTQILIGLFVSFTPLLLGAQQITINGTVYDSTKQYGVPYVSVLSTGGNGTVTNQMGHYSITVNQNDSIWFSYLNKPTPKYPVKIISGLHGFDISLQVHIDILDEVKVKQRNYRLDSLQNRQDYAKAFDYAKPKLGVVTPQYGGAAGFDLNSIVEIFQVNKRKRMLSFQKRLLEEEKEKFISHRFSEALVRRLTGMTNQEQIDSFMRVFRPPLYIVQHTNDYDFQSYIKAAYERFKKGLEPDIPLMFREDNWHDN